MRSSDHYGSHRLLTDPCLHRIDGGSGSSIESFWDNAAVVVPAVYKEWLSRNTSDGSKQIPPTWLVEQYSVYLYQRWDASAPCHCPNRGYESGIFLRFLSDHYSRLPSVVAFVQADWLQEARMRPPEHANHAPLAGDLCQQQIKIHEQIMRQHGLTVAS